jgi:hypothetical protein
MKDSEGYGAGPFNAEAAAPLLNAKPLSRPSRTLTSHRFAAVGALNPARHPSEGWDPGE